MAKWLTRVISCLNILINARRISENTIHIGGHWTLLSQTSLKKLLEVRKFNLRVYWAVEVVISRLVNREQAASRYINLWDKGDFIRRRTWIQGCPLVLRGEIRQWRTAGVDLHHLPRRRSGISGSGPRLREKSLQLWTSSEGIAK